MTTVKFFTPPNRLAIVIGGPDDPTMDVLVRRAQTRVRAMGDMLREHIGQMRRVIADLAARPEEEIFAECTTLGDAALAICEVAGAADLPETGDAARGLYAMVQALINDGVWHTEALILHVDALGLLNASPPPAPELAAQILQRLKEMRQAVGVTE